VGENSCFPASTQQAPKLPKHNTKGKTLRIKENQTPKTVYSLFIFILLFAPLAFATVEIWSLAIVQISIGLLGILVFWNQHNGCIASVKVPGAVPLLLMLLWMVFQVIPLPPWLVGFLSPGTVEVYAPVHALAGDAGAWMPLSVHQKATILETLRIGSYALFYVLTIQILANGPTLQKTVRIVAGVAVFIAFLAIIQRYTSPDLIFWFREGPEGARFMGPWINRSQFAGFMTMLLPLLLALFLYYRPVVDKEEPLRARIVEFFSSPGSNYQLLVAFGSIVVLLSIMLSLSRGGMIVAVLSLALFRFYLSRKKGKRSWPALVVFFIGICLFFYTFGSDEIIERINDSFTPEGELDFSRLPIWQDTLKIIKVFWLTGAGFGTFVDVFPGFKTIQSNAVFYHAHNDYLELLTDGGIVALGLAAWFVLAVIKGGWAMIVQRRDNFAVLLGIGSLVGVCSMLLYSLTDFNMHNGADGLYFFFLCALLISCVNTRFQYRSSATLLGDMKMQSRSVVIAGSVVLLASVLIFPVRVFLADRMYYEVTNVYLSPQLAESRLTDLYGRVDKIQRYDPFEGVYTMVLGDIEKYRGNSRQALHQYIQASRVDPLRGEFLQKAALQLPEEKIDLAERVMELSYQRSLKKDSLMLGYAEWLLWRGQELRAAEVLRKGLDKTRDIYKDAVPLLDTYFTPDQVADILPPQVQVWINYGKFLEDQGDLKGSEYFRSRALEFVENEKNIRSWWYSQLYNFYRKQQKEAKAVEVLRRAVTRFPGNVGFHIRLGDYFKKQGIYYRAKQEYEQAMLFDPGNENIRRRLESLEQ
jgi:O-antigen ligase/tetratricopeptide (TPR) repeat protein